MQFSIHPPRRTAWGRAVGFLFGLSFSTSLAVAGPNTDGSLIVHAPPNLIYTEGRSWSGYSDLSRCERAVSDAPAYDGSDSQKIVWFVMAAFPSYASPKVLGVTFGIEYDSQVTILEQRLCGADFELAQQAWPASRSGTALTWNEPEKDRVFEIYWFGGYGYAGATFSVIPHPQQGGYFGDNSIPSELDRIDGYGSLGFGVSGENPCLAFLPNGACCDNHGHCTIQIEDQCEDRGMTYFGDYTTCDPGSCLGPCCIQGECYPSYSPYDCGREGGEFKDMGRDCSRTACVPTRTSWSVIKKVYRTQ